MRRIALLLFVLCVSPVAVHAAIFTVNDAGDAGDATPGNGTCATAGAVCTLRAALQEANALAGTDTINFGIGSGPQTIQPASPLPISSSMVIDGTTQLGSGAGPFILLDGQNSTTIGLEFAVIGSLNVAIHGLAIGRFTLAGIKTWQSASGVVIRRCHIGVGLDGVTDMGNGDGIWAVINDLGGSSLVIGDASGGGNVISGNNDMGLEIVDNGGAGAKLGTLILQGNTIGLASDGMTAVPNASGGIRTNLQFTSVTIGGSVAGRNLISGNGGGGYITQGFLQADLFNFSDNYVGLAQDGITARGNGGAGAILVARQYTVLSNILGSNQGNGLYLTTGNQISSIRGNRIGVAADGSARGNTGNGIRINSLNSMTVGGPGTDANIIANNGADGIALTSSGFAQIAENSIYANTGLGIDLNEDGVSANDSGDSDSGGNDLQNHPTISSAVHSGGITFVDGALSAAASTTYTLRFYASTSPDPSGYGEGETYLGSATVTTNALGTASFNFQSPVALGLYITATAANPSGFTSEFSNAVVVNGPPQIRMAAPSVTTPESGTVALTIERVFGSTGAASVDWMTIPGSAGTSDYTSASGTANFANGETTKTINIAITPDALDEPTESLNVELSNVSVGTDLGTAHTTIHITDDDPAPSLSIADASGVESNAPLPFDVTLSAPSGRTITVDYLTSNGTAIAGSDYAAAAGTVTFAPGETLKTINVQLVNDTSIELSETFDVTLSNPAEATIADGTATGTITNDDGPPTITIDDVAVVEGDAGAATALFTVTLSGPSASPVTVDWSTSSGTATAGTDYESGSGTLTFAPGDQSETIAITIDGDTLIEDNETFSVDLASPGNATLADATGGGSIADDDGTPSLSVNDPAVVEGVSATFTVTLAPASALPVTVTYATSDLSASSSSDYTGDTNTLTFAAGETSKTVDIATTNDGIAESAESLRLTLSSPSGATIGDATGDATILDDDGEPRVTIGNATLAEGNGGTSTMTFTIDLSHASASAIDVTWTTADGTATAGSDYTATGGTITFAPSEVSKTVDVTIDGDTVVEPDETLVVQLTGATNATITDDEGAGTITNDDGAVTVSIANVSASEGTGGTTTFAFDVTLNAASSQAIGVQWASADDTASAGSDYAAGAGSLVFAPGDTSETISIAIQTDSTFEPTETFFINLLAATNASIADAQATGTIVNDDPAPAVPSISIGSASLAEGNAGTASMTFTVQLDMATINTVTVDFASGGGTAAPGADYVATGGTLTFAPSVTSQSIVVPVIGDTLVEGNETFLITLSSPSNGTLGAAAATGTILDDDSLPFVPAIAIADVTRLEGDSGATVFTFPIVLDAPATVPVSVSWATVAGSASASTDFVAANGTVVFAPGMTSQSVSVAVHGDETHEPDETFLVTLSAPVNGTLADANAIGTIRNDDDRPPVIPALSVAAVTVDESAGAASLTLTLSSRPSRTASVRWMTRGGTATGGSGFTEAAGQVVFGSSTTATIPLVILDDGTDEDDETFVVELYDANGVTLLDLRAEVTITDDDVAATPRAIVLVAGSLRGDAGSRFGTAVQMVNATDVRAEGKLILHGAGSLDATLDVTIPYSLAPHELRSWADLLAENGVSGLGTLDVIPTAGAIPRMTVRIYDDGGEGTTGFTLPLVTPADALIAGDTGVLIAPADPIASRFNIGVRTLDAGAAMTVTVRNHAGTIVHTETRDYVPNYFTQLAASTFAGTPLSAGDYLEVHITHGSAILYGASVDNVTNDPSVEVVVK